jgi:hypothetical protein
MVVVPEGRAVHPGRRFAERQDAVAGGKVETDDLVGDARQAVVRVMERHVDPGKPARELQNRGGLGRREEVVCRPVVARLATRRLMPVLIDPYQ